MSWTQEALANSTCPVCGRSDGENNFSITVRTPDIEVFCVCTWRGPIEMTQPPKPTTATATRGTRRDR